MDFPSRIIHPNSINNNISKDCIESCLQKNRLFTECIQSKCPKEYKFLWVSLKANHSQTIRACIQQNCINSLKEGLYKGFRLCVMVCKLKV